MPANLANSRMHWRKKHQLRTEYFAACELRRMTRQLPPPPTTPWPRASVTVAMVLGAAMDDDNAVARCKWPLDWLVRAGYVADDRRSALRWGAFPTQTITRLTPPSLTITLERVA
jgi:hypothetical protein